MTKTVKGDTWLDPEEFCYPSGSIYAGRRARARVIANPNRPHLQLPYGELRTVRVGTPDTYFSIPARLLADGRTIRGYVSVDTDKDEFTFTPNGKA